MRAMMPGMQPPLPSTVTLERRTRAHAEALFAVLAEPRLYQYLDEAPPESVEALRQKLARSESGRSPDGSEQWLNCVVRDASQQVLGNVQATIFPSGETNVAYVFGSAHWGRGLAFEAMRQMLGILATEFGVNNFLIVAERANTRSVRLAQRLGFSAATAELAARKALTPTELLLRRGPA